MNTPIGRNRERGERDGGVRAAEKQRIMASAALWPGAPSSFLVRALWRSHYVPHNRLPLPPIPESWGLKGHFSAVEVLSTPLAPLEILSSDLVLSSCKVVDIYALI